MLEDSLGFFGILSSILRVYTDNQRRKVRKVSYASGNGISGEQKENSCLQLFITGYNCFQSVSSCFNLFSSCFNLFSICFKLFHFVFNLFSSCFNLFSSCFKLFQSVFKLFQSVSICFELFSSCFYLFSICFKQFQAVSSSFNLFSSCFQSVFKLFQAVFKPNVVGAHGICKSAVGAAVA